MSHVDFAKLYVENHMAKFNAFDEHCDASAILILLGKVPVFSVDVQSAAGAVREARNAWAHCVFSEWDPVNFQQKFDAMGKLVNKLGLPGSLTNDLLKELKDWETKGTILCSNATMDPDLLKLVQQHLHDLMKDVEKLSSDVQEDRERVSLTLEELEKRLDRMQLEQGTRTQDLSQKIECVEQRVSQLENQEASSLKSSADVMSHQCHSTVSAEISMFDADITFFSKRHDPDTRQWFFDDFNAWFRDPGDSRAYVLLGDPGVGKSVIAGALAKQMRETGQLGAAYFCRHDDGTRNDPRYLLGTVAHQLCACNDKYKEIVGGEDGVKMLLGNPKLGVRELFTKLLHEPLSKSISCHLKLLVIIDALDETEYESREDFLDLIKRRFPLLPEWLVFFVTSRPEDSVQSRLKRYNPCIKICAGNSDYQNCYQKHEQDIQRFLEKRIQFSRIAISIEDVSKKCDGLFLYAQYIVQELKDAIVSGKKINNLNDLFPGDIDEFFLQNFERVCVQVGENIFKKLCGCAMVAPSRLPVSIISYILERENSTRDEQQVVDAISQFVVLRSADQTLTFLHSLVPAWLSNKPKARKLFISKKTAIKYIRDIFVEIVTSFLQNSPMPRSSIDVDLLNYVVRFAVRFLCEFGGKDSLKPIFNCLTSYQYIERRLLCGKIEIYHLLEDFDSAVELLTADNRHDQNILHEISAILTSNALFLSEWPRLLHTCLRSASAALPETVLVSEFSGPYLECNFSIFVDSNIADMQCFATSSDKKLVAGSDGHFLLLFDASKAQLISDVCRLGGEVEIKHIEFSPDDKFIFFGYLNKWFSVERRRVETIPKFPADLPFYQWGVFTRDTKYIVVKKQKLQNEDSCRYQCCITYLVTLWALKEIEQSQDEEMTVRFNYKGDVFAGRSESRLLDLFNFYGIEPAYDPLLLEVREAVRVTYHNCFICLKLKSLFRDLNGKSPLESVRLLIIDLYPQIFQYQVWDVQTGKPGLKHLFAGDAQLDAFTYFSHFGHAFSDFNFQTIFCDIGEARSICNIAVLRAIYCTTRLGIVCWNKLRAEMGLKPFRDCSHLMRTWKRGELLQEILQEMLRPKSTKKRYRTWDALSTLSGMINYLWETETRYPLQNQSDEFEQLSLQTLENFNNRALTFDVCSSIPKGFQNLVHEMKKKIFLNMSPERKWIIAANDMKFVTIIPRSQERDARRISCGCKWFSKFTFTNDDLFFIFTADTGVSLCALSLETGSVLTSVTGCKPYYFSKEGQFGYLFCDDTEQKAVFLSNLFCPFMFISESQLLPTKLRESVATMSFSSSAFTPVKSLPESLIAQKSVATVFCSADSVINVTSDSRVTVWLISKPGEVITIKSQNILTLETSHVKSCVLSPSGRVIAIHQGTTVNLYILTDANFSEVLHEMDLVEAEGENSTVFMMFSSDSTSLLLCIQDFRHSPLCFVWDVQRKSRSGNFRSQTLLTIDCCCLSSCKTKLILCGEYQIEIWKYNENPCRLLSRLGVEKPYQSVNFRQCCVSLDDEFLACCIANRILVYNLNASHINSSKQVLRGHLGRIDFCRFLRVNRYLISNGTDGMVFLWDMSGFKAVGFAKIAQGEESILSMAVSPEEDEVVCFNSSGRVCLIKLRGLGSALVLKTALYLEEGRSRVEIADTSLRLAGEIVSTSREPNSVTMGDEMEEAESTSDSEEDMYSYYLEHERLVDSDDEC